MIKMSKNRVLIDILERNDDQNVQETSLNRHFGEKLQSKCPSNVFFRHFKE
jgi:hypothetical protein